MTELDTRKKWLIGCGGCLGVVVVLLLLTLGIGFMGAQSCQSTSQNVSQRFFGEAPPKGYGVIVAMESPIMMLQMSNREKGLLLTVTQDTPPDSVYERYRKMSPDDMEEFSRYAINGANKLSISSAELKGVTTMTLFGKTYPVSKLVYNTNNAYIPALMTAVAGRQGDKKIIISLLLQNMSARSGNADNAFEKPYAKMGEELEAIIENADFAKSLVLNE